MAGNRQVAREDVVRISFETPENPFQEMVDSINDFKKSLDKTVDGAEKELQDLGKAGKEAGKGFQDIAKESKVFGKILSGIDTDIGSFNTRMANAKKKFDSFKTSLKNISIHPLKNTANSLSKIVSTLTGGQKGVKGFVTGLKNVGKIGFEKLISGTTKLKDGLKDVVTKLTEIAKKAGTTAYNALKKVAGVSFKAVVAGLGASATAVGAIVTKSVQSFADYEQLVGGVDTLFKDSSKAVQKNADIAFRTAGLSANAYMETVTGFSASLLQSLGGDTTKAASVADKAIIDMSDNANKMGTSMESIQNAYQGFAKQNYTMLDNLKLGYGGTKEEMQRLLKDAGKLAGKTFNIKSYADIIEAIHVVQDEMGITGTTAKEASTTITGSLSAMKGAWQNVLTGLVTGDNLKSQIQDLVDSIVGIEDETGKKVGGVINNIMPAVQEALKGVGVLIDSLAPIIVSEVPGLVNSLLPPLLSAATSIVQGLVSALPSILQTVTSSMGTVVNGLTNALVSLLDVSPKLVSIGIDLITSLIAGVSQALPILIPALADSLVRIINSFVVQIPAMVDTGIELIMALIDGILSALPIIIEQAPKIISNLVQAFTTSLPRLITAGIELINKLIEGLIQNLPSLIDSAIKMVDALVSGLVQNLPALINGAISLINALVGGLMDNLPQIIGAAQQLITGLCNGLIQNLPIIIQSGIQLILALVNALINNMGMLLSAAIQLIIGIAQGLLNNLGIIIQASIHIIIAVVSGLIQAIPTLLSVIPEIFGAFINAILSINWLDVGISIIKGIWEGIKGMGAGLVDGIKGLFSGKKSDLSSNGSTAGNSYANGLQGSLNSISLEPTSSKITSELNLDLTDTGTLTAETYTGSMNTGLTTAVKDAKTTTTDITKQFSSLDLTNEGSDTVQGLINGMNSKKGSAVQTARSIANAINAEYRKIQDINSPSGVWEKYGAFQIQGGIKGMQKELPKLEATVQEVGSASMPNYTPENSYTTTNNSSTQNNNYNPTFVLNMNGASASEDNKRKVIRWIQEAISETFNSMERTNPLLTEV